MKFLKWFAAVFVVLICILLIIPFFIDINDYKPEIQEQATKALGRKVEIRGDLSASLIPSPGVTLNDVHIANVPGAYDNEFLSVKEVSVSVAWLPLLSKKIEIVHIYINEPVTNLEKLPNGKGNWAFDINQEQVIEAEQKLSEEEKMPFAITLNDVKIKNGEVRYQEGGETQTIKYINAQISTSLNGSFSADGSLDYQDNKINFKANVVKMSPKEPINVEVTIKVKDNQIITQGKLDAATLTYAGDFSLALDKNTFTEYNIPIDQNIAAKGTISASQERITISPLSVTIGNDHATGEFDISLTGAQAFNLSLSGLPGQSDISLKGQLAQNTTKQLSLQSKNLKELLAIVKVDTSSLPAKLLGSADIRSHYTFQKDSIALNDLNVVLGGSQITGNIRWKNSIATIDLKTPNVSSWLKVLDIKAPLEGALGAKGTVDGDTSALKTNLSLSIAGGQLSLKGSAKNITATPALDMDVTMNYANAGQLTKAFGSTAIPKSIKAVNASFHVKGSPQKMTFNNLKATIGLSGQSLSLSGNGSIDTTGSKPNITAKLHVPTLKADMLLAADTNLQNKLVIQLASKTITPSTSSTFKGWSREPIDFGFMNAVNMDLQVSADDVYYDNLHFKQVTLPIRLQNNAMNVDFKSSAVGGSINGTLHATPNSISTNLKVTNADLQAIPGGKDIGISGGRLNGDISVKTSGNNQFALVLNLNGQANVHIHGGQLKGFDLPGLSASLKEADSFKNPMGILNLLTTHMKEGSTPIDKLGGHFTIHNGVARTNDFQLLMKAANGNVVGTIDLPHYKMDMLATVSMTAIKELPPFKVQIKGPLDAPNKTIIADNLVQFIMQKYAGKAINKVLNKAIGNKLPIDLPGLLDDSADTTPETTPTSPEQIPEKLLKGVFKNLF
jgi:uncharacterized protein involved in outer membrane biogenesis